MTHRTKTMVAVKHRKLNVDGGNKRNVICMNENERASKYTERGIAYTHLSPYLMIPFIPEKPSQPSGLLQDVDQSEVIHLSIRISQAY